MVERRRSLHAAAIAAFAAIAVGALLALSGCTQKSSATQSPAPKHASIERVEAEGINRIRLSDEAATRLRLQYVEARADGDRAIVPYEALLYDPTGKEWVYVSPSPQVFERKPVKVDLIEGKDVIYASGAGPAPGSRVVTMGAVELFGIEFGVGK